MRQNLPPTFCSLPWINLSTDVNGSLRPCCKFAQPSVNNKFQLPNMREGLLKDLWNDQKFQDLRIAFLNGEQPEECSSCWNEEAAGLPSFRTTFEKHKKLSIGDDEYKPFASSGPKSLDLKLNNVCNLKCRICSHQASSTFLKEYEQINNVVVDDGDYWLSNKILGTHNEDNIKEWAKDLQHIEMTGGEPMFSPENIKVLKLLISSGYSHNISLLINTNATFYNSKLINLTTKFKECIYILSIDDIGMRLEYERYPSQWSDILKNISQFVKLKEENKNIDVVLSPTISVFNVYYLPEYYEWAKQFGVRIINNVLHYNTYHSIKNLPLKLKQVVNDKLKNDKYDVVKNFLWLEGNNEIAQLQKSIIELDNFRKQNFVDVFGVWGKLIMEYSDD